MGSKTLERLRAEAMQLDDSDRAALAHDLVQSLDLPADPDAATAWEAESARRLAALDDGTARTIDRAELHRRLRARRLSG